MIHIYHKGFSAADKQGILKILSFVQITAEECLFIDSTIEDIDIKGKDFILCFGSYKEVTRALVASGFFKVGDLLGKDTYDPSSSFSLINIPYDMTQIFSKEEVKQVVWSKLSKFGEYYINVCQRGANKVKQPPQQMELPFDDDISMIAPVHVVENAALTTVDVETLMAAISQTIDLSDIGLGKSLSLSSKIELDTPSGKLVIYPTNRIATPDANKTHLSFKDSLALLRLSIMFDATKISFFNDAT